MSTNQILTGVDAICPRCGACITGLQPDTWVWCLTCDCEGPSENFIVQSTNT